MRVTDMGVNMCVNMCVLSTFGCSEFDTLRDGYSPT